MIEVRKNEKAKTEKIEPKDVEVFKRNHLYAQILLSNGSWVPLEKVFPTL